jgi:hypothetical protein
MVFRAYRSYKDFKLRISPWIALIAGIAFLGWVIADKRGSVGFGDLYPGLLLFVASGLLFAYVRFVFRHDDDEDGDEDSEE